MVERQLARRALLVQNVVKRPVRRPADVPADPREPRVALLRVRPQRVALLLDLLAARLLLGVRDVRALHLGLGHGRVRLFAAAAFHGLLLVLLGLLQRRVHRLFVPVLLDLRVGRPPAVPVVAE